MPWRDLERIEVEAARQQFAAVLAKFMAAGVLDRNEQKLLEHIASSVGLTIPEFVEPFVQIEGEGFLRGVFLACVADNILSECEWKSLLETRNPCNSAAGDD